MAKSSEGLPSGYCLTKGSSLDRALLVRTMQHTYEELHPGQALSHLAHTVDQYLSQNSMLWWAEKETRIPPSANELMSGRRIKHPIACLWLGDAIDQIDGDRHTYIFLLYVKPAYRRQGIGRALMAHAETWAKSRGDRKISLQVFCNNTPAVKMYERLKYRTQSLWMTKPL